MAQAPPLILIFHGKTGAYQEDATSSSFSDINIQRVAGNASPGQLSAPEARQIQTQSNDKKLYEAS